MLGGTCYTEKIIKTRSSADICMFFYQSMPSTTLRGEFGRAWKTSVTLSNVVLEIRDSRSSF